jgi:hypothetical protein
VLNLLLIQILAWLVMIAAVTGGATILLRTWLRNRHALTADDVRRLMTSVEDIHHTLEDLRAEQDAFRRRVDGRVDEISGRVEFAERLLTEGESPRN